MTTETAPRNFSKYPDHPYVSMFPLMTGQPFDDLVESVKAHGQQVPCVRHKGQIIDGRNRIRACIHLGIKPLISEWAPPSKERDVEAQILEFIVSMNLHRRQLSPSQRAMIAADYCERVKAARWLDGNGDMRGRRSCEIAAEMFDISKQHVHRASVVKRSGDEATIEKVGKGEMSLHTAHDAVRCKELSDHELRIRARRRVIYQFEVMVNRDAPNFPEFSDVWDAMRKRLGKIAEHQATNG